MSEEIAARTEYRMEEWAARIRERNDSGLTVREFCRRNAIREKTYYYWLKKLRTAAIQAAPSLRKVDASSDEVELLRIRYGSCSMELPAYADLDAVAAVLKSVMRQ